MNLLKLNPLKQKQADFTFYDFYSISCGFCLILRSDFHWNFSFTTTTNKYLINNDIKQILLVKSNDKFAGVLSLERLV